MHTAVYTLYRKEGWTREEFTEYWLNVHRPIAVKMPYVRGYEIWPVTDAAETLSDEIDGFVILRFDSEEDFHRCHESPEFAAAAEDARMFTRHFTRHFVDAHEVIAATA
jgi:uncharacterized protein (TIGR02118 family)